MSWSLIQSTSTTTASSTSLTLSGVSVTAGDLLVVCATASGGLTSFAVSDNSGSNTWSQDVVTAKNSTTNDILAIWHTVAQSTATINITLTPSTGSPGQSLGFSEWRVSSGTISVDGTNSAIYTTSTSTPSAGTIPVSGTGDLVIAALSQGSTAYAGNYTAGAGFTLDTNQSLTASPQLAVEYDLSQSSGIAGAFTVSGSKPWNVAGVSYSVTASGGSSFVFPSVVVRPRFEPAYFE